MTPHPLTNFEIQNCYQNKPRFNGVWSRKNSPRKIKNGNMTVCYYHVIYKFQSESTFYSLPKCQGNPCLKQAPYLKFK